MDCFELDILFILLLFSSGFNENISFFSSIIKLIIFFLLFVLQLLLLLELLLFILFLSFVLVLVLSILEKVKTFFIDLLKYYEKDLYVCSWCPDGFGSLG